MATDPAGRFDPVRWADALGCRGADDLATTLNQACGRVDAIASDAAAVQCSLSGLADVDPDTDDMLLLFRALAEGVWMVLDFDRRAATTAADGRIGRSRTAGVRGGVR
ncbi:hypothetical protein [Aquipuribacter sp. MA13-6]|uniref:hypothetical protein n=1 Tax=unclassified Aquipuribacter TaxID=2635084 RepID=UPI003EF007ED